METNGNLLNPMGTYGYIYIYIYIWKAMEIHENRWTPMETYGNLWKPIGIYIYI